MKKDMDTIAKETLKNLKTADIKEANGLSTDKEMTALFENLKDIIQSDFYAECLKTTKCLQEKAAKKYPEYFLPIVADDPLKVVFERLLKILPRLKASIEVVGKNKWDIKYNEDYEMIFRYLLFDLLNEKYYDIIHDFNWENIEHWSGDVEIETGGAMKEMKKYLYFSLSEEEKKYVHLKHLII